MIYLLALFSILPYRFDAVESDMTFPWVFVETESLEQLNTLRLDALRIGHIQDKQKKRFPVKVNGVKGKIQLKGHWNDHRSREKKWSFRVKLKDKVLGSKDFSLQHPDTRNGLWEYLIHKVLKDEGFKTIDYRFVRVFLNGSDWGLFAFEGRFKGLAPTVGRIKGSGPLRDRFAFVYDKKNTDPRDVKEITLLLNAFKEKSRPASEIFHPEVSKLIAIHRLFGSLHGLGAWNLRFYLDKGKLRPISYDCLGGLYLDVGFVRKEVERKDNFHGFIMQDSILRAEYRKQIQRISSEEYLNDMIDKYQQEIVTLLYALRKEFPKPLEPPHPKVVQYSPQGNSSRYLHSRFNFGPLIHNQIVLKGEFVY